MRTIRSDRRLILGLRWSARKANSNSETRIERSDHTTYCSYKGEANYYSIPALGDAGMNAVWDEWVAQGNTPPRATVEAKLANPKCLVEIVVVAAQR